MAAPSFDPSLDYYASLGISPGASIKEIKQAYHQLAKNYHPDVALQQGARPSASSLNPFASSSSSTGGSERFVRINEAFQILSNRVSRGRYDAERSVTVSHHLRRHDDRVRRARRARQNSQGKHHGSSKEVGWLVAYEEMVRPRNLMIFTLLGTVYLLASGHRKDGSYENGEPEVAAWYDESEQKWVVPDLWNLQKSPRNKLGERRLVNVPRSFIGQSLQQTGGAPGKVTNKSKH